MVPALNQTVLAYFRILSSCENQYQTPPSQSPLISNLNCEDHCIGSLSLKKPKKLRRIFSTQRRKAMSTSGLANLLSLLPSVSDPNAGTLTITAQIRSTTSRQRRLLSNKIQTKWPCIFDLNLSGIFGRETMLRRHRGLVLPNLSPTPPYQTLLLSSNISLTPQ